MKGEKRKKRRKNCEKKETEAMHTVLARKTVNVMLTEMLKNEPESRNKTKRNIKY